MVYPDEQLLACAREFEQGLTGDALGGNLYKKRVSIEGRGKRRRTTNNLALQGLNGESLFLARFHQECKIEFNFSRAG